MLFVPQYPIQDIKCFTSSKPRITGELIEYFEQGYEPVFNTFGYLSSSTSTWFGVTLQKKDDDIKYDDVVALDQGDRPFEEYNETIQDYLDDGWLILGTPAYAGNSHACLLLVHPVNGGEIPVEEGARVIVQPNDFSCLEGDTATFSVVAQGQEPIQYQWQEYVNGSWVNVTNDENLIIENVSLLENNKTFRCQVANEFGGESSQPCQLTVTECCLDEGFNARMFFQELPDGSVGFDFRKGYGTYIYRNNEVRDPFKIEELTAIGSQIFLVGKRDIENPEDDYAIRVEGSDFTAVLNWSSDHLCYYGANPFVAEAIVNGKDQHRQVFLQYFEDDTEE